MGKRRNENENLEDSSKNLNFNKNNDDLTPPQTPTSSFNKYNFNIWNKSKVENVMKPINKSKVESVMKPIKISDLKVAVCMQRPLIFRVSFKSDKRGSKNADMFVFHAMCDSEIQVTVFPQETTRFFDVIQFNRTYELTNFNVKKESEDFPIFIGEGVYLSLLASSKIKELNNDSVPELQFNFLKIQEIESLAVNSKCDCIAVIAENWGEQTVGKNKLKRDLSITDDSKECMVVTLWGAAYEKFDYTGTCVLIHNGVVNQYNGIKTISCAPNTLFWHNPDIAKAKDLKSWFNDELKKLSNE